MFLKSLFKGFTTRQTDAPPSNVLDIGCGSGLWIIEAAKHWPVSVSIFSSHVSPASSPFSGLQICRLRLPSSSA